MNLHDFFEIYKTNTGNENASAGYYLFLKSMLSDWKNGGDLP
jgi:hypothetical protein